MPDQMTATGVVQLHPAPEDKLREWLARTTEAARLMPGFRSMVLSEYGGGLSLAVATTFESPEQLHAWLDTRACTDSLSNAHGDGIFSKSSTLLIVDGQRLPPGTAVFIHDVIEDRTTEFIETERALAETITGYAGFSSVVLLAPAPGTRSWMAILKFRTDEHLSDWFVSDDRAAGLAKLRTHLTGDIETLSVDSPFGSILRIDDGRPTVTPRWRTVLLIVLVLYPTVMLLSRFYVPVLHDLGLQPWLTTWMSQLVSVSVLTYLLMPRATRLFARWLDPVDGRSARVTALGAAAVLVSYAATLLLFASVRWLQFWDYA